MFYFVCWSFFLFFTLLSGNIALDWQTHETSTVLHCAHEENQWRHAVGDRQFDCADSFGEGFVRIDDCWLSIADVISF